MEGTNLNNIENERSPEDALNDLQKREKELLATNEVQVKLASQIFPEEATLEDMLIKWATSEEHYSEKFRKIIEEDKDLKERILNGDDTVVEEIMKLLVN